MTDLNVSWISHLKGGLGLDHYGIHSIRATMCSLIVSTPHIIALPVRQTRLDLAGKAKEGESGSYSCTCNSFLQMQVYQLTPLLLGRR